jgi:hypothetical protein
MLQRRFPIIKRAHLPALAICMTLLVAALAYLAHHGRRGTKAPILAHGQATEVYKPFLVEIDGFTLACSNTRLCTARSVDEDLVEYGGFMDLVREAGPAGTITVSIGQWQTNAQADLTNPRLDWKPLAIRPAWRRLTYDYGLSLEGQQAFAFARAISGGKLVTFGRGSGTFSISLSGLRKALARMDEVQGREGTTTALVLVGQEPASSVPAAPEPPVLHAFPMQPPLLNGPRFAAAVRQSAAQDLLQARQCDTDLDHARIDAAYALDGTTNLVLLGCAHGAYQMSLLVFVAPKDQPGKAALLALPPREVQPSDEADLVGELVNTEWDPETSTLSSEARARGFGDCGEFLAWAYLGNGRWALSEQRLIERCGGGHMPWPQIYKAAVIAHKVPNIVR